MAEDRVGGRKSADPVFRPSNDEAPCRCLRNVDGLVRPGWSVTGAAEVFIVSHISVQPFGLTGRTNYSEDGAIDRGAVRVRST